MAGLAGYKKVGRGDGVPTLNAEQERARRSVAEFRRLLPTLTAYARNLTGNRSVRVEMDAQSNGHTDGKKIYFRPPVALGDVATMTHDKSVCDKRDPDTFAQLCGACEVREGILATVYHEISHIAFDTFLKVGSDDVKTALSMIERSAPDWYYKQVKSRYDSGIFGTIESFLALAHAVNPYFKSLVNGLEDVRINERMAEARPGTRIMQKAMIYKVAIEGVEQKDAQGRIKYVKYPEYEPNLQAAIGLYCRASGYAIEGWFSERVERALLDAEITRLCRSVPTLKTARQVFEHSFEIFLRMRELGFFVTKDEKLPEPEPESEPEEGESDESSEPESGKPGESSEEDSGGAEGAASDSPGTPSGEPGDSSDGTDGGADVGQNDERTDDEAGSDESDDESRNSSGVEGASDSEDSDGSESDSGERVSEANSSGDSNGEGPGDSSSTSDSASTEGDPAGDASGDGETDSPSEVDGGEEGDNGRLGQEELSSGDNDDEEVGSHDAHSHEQLDDVDPLDYRPEEERDGTEGESEPIIEPTISNDSKIELVDLGLHREVPEPEPATEQEMQNAIVQGVYFTKPSSHIGGLRVWQYDDRESDLAKRPWHAWGGLMNKGLYGQQVDPTIDEIGEQYMGPALMKLRLAFEDNQRSHRNRNQRAGKIDGRVLGKRAWGDDDRLFGRKVVAKKKDYFVCIGLDVSGSTRGVNIKMIKEAALAQADLCARLGVKFAVYAHTGGPLGVEQLDARYVDIYEIKAPDQPWDNKSRTALAEIGPSAANLDGHTLEYYRKVCDAQSTTDKVILYYSDGAMPLENYNEELEILQSEIALCKQKRYTLLGVGVRTDSPRNHGLDTVQIDDSSQVGKVVAHLERALRP